MANSPIPERGSALTAEWMRQTLGAGAATGFPAIRDMVVEDIGTGAGALSEILRCTMRYEDDGAGAPESVVVKLCSSDNKSLRIARLLGMYRREYNFFRQLAPHLPIGLPALLYGDWEESGHRFVLVLEDLQGMEVMDQISGAGAAQARRAIRGVAELHGQFWNRLDRPPVASFLASVRPPRRWVSQLLYLTCLAPCMKRFGSLFSNRKRRLAEAYGPRVAVHMDELARGPRTLTHGDFRLENMFFGTGESDAFTVIDWQAAGMIGNGLYDVAYFMVTSVPTEVRRDIERDALGGVSRDRLSHGREGFPVGGLLEPLSPERAEHAGALRLRVRRAGHDQPADARVGRNDGAENAGRHRGSGRARIPPRRRQALGSRPGLSDSFAQCLRSVQGSLWPVRTADMAKPDMKEVEHRIGRRRPEALWAGPVA